MNQVKKISVNQIVVYAEQRELRQSHVNYLADKMSRQGFNPSYPVTLDDKNGLIDGGHRLAAAQRIGLSEIPYITLNGDTRRIYHAIRCNEDGADTQKYDVFDYAELCFNLSTVAGWTGEQIADELGWGSASRVTYYGNIKSKLHQKNWDLAKTGINKKLNFVNGDDDDLVNQELTIVNWSESHFRALLAHLSGNDRGTYRAQRAVIEHALRLDKLTAKKIEQAAIRQAWHLKLARYMRDTLVSDVSLSNRKILLRNIKRDVFGDKPGDKEFEKFQRAVSSLNEQVLGVKLYQDDALQFIPTLEDESIALVVADPPYNVTDHEWDKIGTDEQFITWLEQWAIALKPKLSKDYHLFLFCSPDYQADIEMMLKRLNMPIKSRVVWEHRNLVKGREVTDKYICNWEMAFHCGTHALNFPPIWDDTRFQVKSYARPQSNFTDKSNHPTAKPIELIKLFVEHGSKPGDMVLDTFAGGGTTGEACQQAGQRRCILVEKEDDFCFAIENRLGIQRVSK